MKGNKWTHKSLFPLCLGLAILLFSTVFLTNSVNASELSVLVEPVASTGDLNPIYNVSTNPVCPTVSTVAGYVQASSSSRCMLDSFYYNGVQGWGLDKSYYLKLTMYIYDIRDKEEVNGYLNEPGYLTMFFNNGSTYAFDTMDQSSYMISQDSVAIQYIYSFRTLPAGTFYPTAIMFSPRLAAQPNEVVKFGGAVLYIPKDLSVNVNIDTQAIINAINNSSDGTAINNLNDTIQEQNDRDEQDRDNIEQASDDADASADSSQQQAEATGSTLLQAFSDFVDALTSASASDCNINFNIMDRIRGGTVNLCSLSVPPAVQTIASLVLIGFCVPLSIATARKVIELFRSFQG